MSWWLEKFNYSCPAPPRAPGCDHFRFVIRNDGSGGVREGKRGERWFTYTYDFDLTPKK